MRRSVRPRTLLRTLGLVALLHTWCVAQCRAQPAEVAGRPMGIAVSGMGGARGVLTLSYPVDPGLATVRKDTELLAESGQWTISPPKRVEDEGLVCYEAEITPAIAVDAAGRLPLFPFLHTFRRFREITLHVVGVSTGPPGDFVGENKYLSAEGYRSGTVTSYTIRIRDGSFKSPEDVAFTEQRGADLAPGPSVATSASVRPGWSLWALLGAGAAGTGFFVWGLTALLLSRHEARNRRSKKDNDASAAK